MQADPILYSGGMNLYGYVGNDPVNFADALGTQEIPQDEIVVTGTRFNYDPCPFCYENPTGYGWWWRLPSDSGISGGENIQGYNPSSLPRDRCGAPPSNPEGADVESNMAQAYAATQGNLGIADYIWFRDQVKNNGPWDYKQNAPPGPVGFSPEWGFQNFGNFNYGAAGHAAGIPSDILYQMAGWGQTKAGTSRPSFGNSGIPFLPFTGSGDFGDAPEDVPQIAEGIVFAKCKGY